MNKILNYSIYRMTKKKSIIYTPEQLHKRQIILQSQLLFGKFLDTDIITSLVDLFKENKKNNITSKIVKYETLGNLCVTT
jgi:hypothetical protein